MSMSCAIHGRHIGRGKQSALIPHFHRHRASADALENLVRKAFGDHTAWRGIEHKRRRMCHQQTSRSANSIRKFATDGTSIKISATIATRNGEQQQLPGEADARMLRASHCTHEQYRCIMHPISNIASTEN